MWTWLRRFGPGEKKSARPFMAWQGPGRPFWSGRDYGAFGREGYCRNAVAHRCVRLIAEAAASVPLRITPAGHPLAALVTRPNPGQTAAELLETFYGYLQVAGNAYLEASGFEGEPPRELYALRPDRMVVLAGPQGWPRGWLYRTGDETREFARDPLTGVALIFHAKLFHPLDDWYGQSPMEAAANAIDIHNAGGAWNKALIDNAARSSGALIHKAEAGRLTEEQYQRLREEIEGALAGATNAGRPLLLEGGIEWRPMSLSPTDMDFIEARNNAAREIALAFGVPPMLLGIPGDNTYANFRKANLAFWRQTVLPLTQKIAGGFEHWLGGRWDERATVSLDLDAVPALAEERERTWARIGGAEFLSTAEKRALVGITE